MKDETHPPYQEVLFVDSATGFKFLCGTTLQSKKQEMHEGKEYPAVYVSVSSASHPFYTGSKQFIDTEGRVDKFLKRYAKAAAPKVAEESEPKEEPKKKSVKKKK